MNTRSPTSTLFPYTTLFRSQKQRSDAQAPLETNHKGRHRARSTSTRCLDRKSTRLNSSHANISYAVFCLKKKLRTGQQVAVTLTAGSFFSWHGPARAGAGVR